MLAYFGLLPGSKLVLWCYLAWYVAIVALYFDGSPMLWVSAAGLSLVIGIALNLATRQPAQRTDRWIIFRLFLIPFCVSSYSALIKDKGFILIFPPRRDALAIGFIACAAVVCVHLVCRSMVARSETTSAQRNHRS
ncbi:MAG: hypothetical protein ACJ8MH_19005 [Povalibacter sp.]